MSTIENIDVCVVGAGVSGLTAAYELLKKHAGLSVLVLEAKDRIGGRTLGKELQGVGGKDMWDMGGQWVGRTQHHIMKLLEELSLAVYEQYATGRKVMQLGSNTVKSYNSMIPKLSWYSLLELHRFMKQMERWQHKITSKKFDVNFATKELDLVTAEDAKLKHLGNQETRDAIDATVRCVFGVEPSDLSLYYFLTYAAAAGGLEPLISAEEGGGQQFKIKGGAFQVCEKLADIIGRELLRLGEPIVSINQTDREVKLVTNSGHVYVCERLILAIPPQELVKINFNPSLPLVKRHVFHRMPVGYLTKVIVTYKKAFWRSAGYSGEAVTNGGTSVIDGCDSGPFCIIYDATSSNDNPALVGFIGGQQQLLYADKTTEERRKAVIYSLVELFGEEARDVLDYAEKNWNEEPYNGGCPVSVGTPGIGHEMATALRQPFGRIHLAGTESATIWCGFINGAVQAGQRAAYEVLYNLRPQALSNEEYDETWYHQTSSSSPSSPARKRLKGALSLVVWLVGIGLVSVVAIAWRRKFLH